MAPFRRIARSSQPWALCRNPFGILLRCSSPLLRWRFAALLLGPKDQFQTLPGESIVRVDSQGGFKFGLGPLRVSLLDRNPAQVAVGFEIIRVEAQLFEKLRASFGEAALAPHQDALTVTGEGE